MARGTEGSPLFCTTQKATLAVVRFEYIRAGQRGRLPRIRNGQRFRLPQGRDLVIITGNGGTGGAVRLRPAVLETLARPEYAALSATIDPHHEVVEMMWHIRIASLNQSEITLAPGTARY
jgi:hypothetical protein